MKDSNVSRSICRKVCEGSESNAGELRRLKSNDSHKIAPPRQEDFSAEGIAHVMARVLPNRLEIGERRPRWWEGKDHYS